MHAYNALECREGRLFIDIGENKNKNGTGNRYTPVSYPPSGFLWGVTCLVRLPDRPRPSCAQVAIMALALILIEM